MHVSRAEQHLNGRARPVRGEVGLPAGREGELRERRGEVAGVARAQGDQPVEVPKENSVKYCIEKKSLREMHGCVNN